MRSLLYRIFFTKSDEVDLSQFFLLGLNILFIVWVVMTGQGRWTVSQPMVDAFLIVYATTVVLASPTWLAKLWIEHRSFVMPFQHNDRMATNPDGPQSPDPEQQAGQDRIG
jgi:hypothetical protein